MHALQQASHTAQLASVPLIHPAVDGASVIFAIAVSATIAGLFLSLLTLWLFWRLIAARRSSRLELENANGAIALRDALLATSGEAVAVLSSLTRQPPSSDEAGALLKTAMAGPDARNVAAAIGELLQSRKSFALAARAEAGAELIAIRGEFVLGCTAIFAKRQGPAAADLDYRALLDIVPASVWVRGPDQALRWGNQAFLDVTDAESFQNALVSNASLQRSEADLAAAALEGAVCVEAMRYALVRGERRAFSLKFVRLCDSSVAGVAIDVTERVRAEGQLRLNVEAAADMLDGIPLAIAVFDKEQRLDSYNGAYAAIWDFAEGWLATRPTLGEILDKLRGTRKLPEQHDYAAWKIAQLRPFEECAPQHEEFWHLVGGRSLRVAVRPHLLGGITVMIEDVSERLRLEASFNLLLQVHRATLDTVEDGIAIFGPDGRLVLFNASFARLWHFTEEELRAQPHFTKVANLAEGRLGHDGIWGIVSAGLVSAEPERCNDWGKSVRADGRVISLSMSRLPNGATIATFCDLTDLERFSAEMAKAHAVA